MARVVVHPFSMDVECETAAEFLQVLDPISGLFHERSLVYRGVRSDLFDLTPSAHRSASGDFQGAVLLNSWRYVVGPQRTDHEQCVAELYTIAKFFQIVDRRGMRLPEDSYQLRLKLDEWKRKFSGREVGDYIWPPPEFYSLIALAQHHRVPTRALEWTWDPFVAAYFAAQGAVLDPPQSLVVWVFDYEVREINPFSPLVTFSVSGADNENLRAQRGLFMLHSQNVTTAESLFEPQSMIVCCLKRSKTFRLSAFSHEFCCRQARPDVCAQFLRAWVYQPVASILVSPVLRWSIKRSLN